MHPNQQQRRVEAPAPPGLALPAIGLAATSLFIDFITVAAAAGELLGLVNAVLAPSGLEVVQTRHRG